MDVPDVLKPIAPYLRLSKQFQSRDPVIAYYCNLYTVQKGIKLASQDADGKIFLLGVMDQLEKVISFYTFLLFSFSY